MLELVENEKSHASSNDHRIINYQMYCRNDRKEKIMYNFH